MFDEKGVSTSLSWAKINLQDLEQSNNIGDITINLDRMMNILPVVFRQICQLLTLNFSKGHTFLKILLPNLLPLWTLVLENMNLFSVQFRKGNNLSRGRCEYTTELANLIKGLLLKIKSPTPHNPTENFRFAPFKTTILKSLFPLSALMD